MVKTEVKKLKEWLQPGKSVRFIYGEDHPMNRLVHIRAIVDDTQIVSRSWSRVKRRLAYKVDDIIWYEIRYQVGHLKEG